MAFTSSQLQALEDAYSAGVLSVTHAGKTATFASMTDLWQAIVRLRAALRSSAKKHRAGVASCGRF